MQQSPEIVAAYKDWLGIEAYELPPDHYRLLGVMRFEADTAKIIAAAELRMKELRSFQMGPRAALSQQLLNEVAAARNCLTSPAQKGPYDAWLQHALRTQLQGYLQQGGQLPPAAAAALGLPGEQPPPLPPPLPSSSAGQPAADEALPEEVDGKSSLWKKLAIAGAAAAILLIATVTVYVGRRMRKPVAKPVMPPVEVVHESEANPTDKPSEEKSTSGTVIVQGVNGHLELLPKDAVLAGGVSIKGEGSEQTLVGWNSAEGSATWNLKLIRPSFFKVDCIYTATEAAAERTLEIYLDDAPPARVNLKPTGNDVKARTDTGLILIKKGGPHVLTIRVREPAESGDWMLLRELRLYPQSTNQKMVK